MTATVSSIETGPRLALRSVVDACAFVDRLGPAGVGELVILRGSVPRGAVFVEAGRICWASARGLAKRLTELLIARSGLDASEMEKHFRRCQAEKVPLGELLVDRGVVRSDDLRSALRQHTIESLAALFQEDVSGAWCARRGGYSPRFTFQTSELLAGWCGHAISDGALAVEALAPFSQGLAREWGGAFIRDASHAAPLPVAARGDLPDKSTEVLRIGKWAATALDLAATFQDQSAFVSSSDEGNGSLVAWRHRALVVAGRMQAGGPARILNYRATQRRLSASGAASPKPPEGR